MNRNAKKERYIKKRSTDVYYIVNQTLKLNVSIKLRNARSTEQKGRQILLESESNPRIPFIKLFLFLPCHWQSLGGTCTSRESLNVGRSRDKGAGGGGHSCGNCQKSDRFLHCEQHFPCLCIRVSNVCGSVICERYEGTSINYTFLTLTF